MLRPRITTHPEEAPRRDPQTQAPPGSIRPALSGGPSILPRLDPCHVLTHICGLKCNYDNHLANADPLGNELLHPIEELGRTTLIIEFPHKTLSCRCLARDPSALHPCLHRPRGRLLCGRLLRWSLAQAQPSRATITPVLVRLAASPPHQGLLRPPLWQVPVLSPTLPVSTNPPN